MQKRLLPCFGVPLLSQRESRVELAVEPKWRRVLLLRKEPHHRPPSRA